MSTHLEELFAAQHARFSAQLSAPKELDVNMSAQVSSQLEEEEACEPGSSQYEEQEACIPAKVSSQSEELNGRMPAQVSSQSEEEEACVPVQGSSQSKELELRMSGQVFSQLEEEEACEPVKGSSQLEEQEAWIPAQVSLQLEEQEACIPSQVEDQHKIEPETDDSLQEDPELEGALHKVELNQCTTIGEITTGRPVTKSYWAERSSLKLVYGCLHRVWKSENGQTFRVLMVVPRVGIPDVLNVQYKCPRGGHLRDMKSLEHLKQRFYWTGCQSAIERIAKYAENIVAKGSRSRSHGQMKQHNSRAPVEKIGVYEDGPFPTNKLGNSHVLVVKDHFNEWPQVYTIPNQETEPVAEAFINKWVTRFGVPMELRSDQEWNLESALSQGMYQKLSIRKTDGINSKKRRTANDVSTSLEDEMGDIKALCLVSQICLIGTIRLRWRAV